MASALWHELPKASTSLLILLSHLSIWAAVHFLSLLQHFNQDLNLNFSKTFPFLFLSCTKPWTPPPMISNATPSCHRVLPLSDSDLAVKLTWHLCGAEKLQKFILQYITGIQTYRVYTASLSNTSMLQTAITTKAIDLWRRLQNIKATCQMQPETVRKYMTQSKPVNKIICPLDDKSFHGGIWWNYDEVNYAKQS